MVWTAVVGGAVVETCVPSGFVTVTVTVVGSPPPSPTCSSVSDVRLVDFFILGVTTKK
jgi:hypothetical protein